jgi:hypothetical protein
MKWLYMLLSLNAGVATTFSAKGDPQNPRPYAACLRRDLDDERDLIVAERSLPCGTNIIICLPRTNKCVRARVGDRGPYGKRRDGSFRATLDLAPAVRKKLRHNGYEQVLWGILQKVDHGL